MADGVAGVGPRAGRRRAVKLDQVHSVDGHCRVGVGHCDLRVDCSPNREPGVPERRRVPAGDGDAVPAGALGRRRRRDEKERPAKRDSTSHGAAELRDVDRHAAVEHKAGDVNQRH